MTCVDMFISGLYPVPMVYTYYFHPTEFYVNCYTFLFQGQRCIVSQDWWDYSGTLCFRMDFGAVGAVLLIATDSMVENKKSADYVDIWIFNNISLCNPWTQSPFLFMPLNFSTKVL